MSSLPPCLAQRREGLRYLEMTQMPVSPLFAHHTASDDADSAFEASPRKVHEPQVVASGSGDICGVELEPWTIQRSSPVTGNSEAELFVRCMRPFVRSSLCAGRRDGGWNEFPA